jgi:hypothetical protein
MRSIHRVRYSRWAAQGIVAESPQELHRQFRGLAAESPVFLSVFGQKNAPEDSRFPIGNLL